MMKRKRGGEEMEIISSPPLFIVSSNHGPQVMRYPAGPADFPSMVQNRKNQESKETALSPALP